MRIIAVDDEALLLEDIVSMLEELDNESEIRGFTSPLEVLEYARENTVDVAFVDVEMPGMNGLKLARELKTLNPAVNIIFCTGYSQYMAEAIQKVHCNGYLNKPVSPEELQEELENLRIPMPSQKKQKQVEGLYIQCFGEFEAFYKGKPIEFGMSKTKELLAFLVDQKGVRCSNGLISAYMWDDEKNHIEYVRKMKQDLKKTLQNLGLSGILYDEMGQMAIMQEIIACDYYEWDRDKSTTAQCYHGHYMDSYSWADPTKALLESYL